MNIFFRSSCLISMTVLISLLAVSINSVFANGQKSIEANGTEIIYVEMGSGPLMILAHGSISDHRRWIKDHLPMLSKSYRVIAYTMRYHGDSSKWDANWPPLSMDLYADDLAAFIKALDSGPAHLVGWSMGADVAHRTTLKYPELVRSAYLYEGAAAMELSLSQTKELDVLREMMFGKSIAFAEEKKYTDAAGALINAVVGKDGFFEGLPPVRQKAIGSKGMVLGKYFDALRNPVVIYTCEQLKENKVPTLLVVGENTTDYFSALFSKYIPCLGPERTVNIPGASHVWPGARFEEFGSSVHEFASEH